MEILSAILLAISPVLVSGITQVVKPPKILFSDGSFRTTALRFGVALLSFGAVVGTAWLGGQEVDSISVQTFVDAVLVFIGATGIYFWAKFKKASV